MNETSSQPDVEAPELVLQNLYRLFKLCMFHELKNEAVHRAIDQSVRFFRSVVTPEAERCSVLFASDTVFVDGNLLKGTRGTYEAAMELGTLLAAGKVNQIDIYPMVEEAHLRTALFEFTRIAKERKGVAKISTKGFRLSWASSSILFDDDDALSLEQQLAKTYAYTVVAMRRLFDGVKDGNYIFSRHVKRLTQRLAMLADEEASALVGLTSIRDANNDEAGRSVNCAVLAVAVARLLSRDLKFLSRVALSAILFDIGLPRAAGMGRADPDRMTPAIPRLNPEQERRVPACTGLVTTALGRLAEESMRRTVIGYEAQWLNRPALLGKLYGGKAVPALESQLVATVWRFNKLVSYDIWSQRQLTVDEAIFAMSRDARSDVERILIDMLLCATGLFPRGTIVMLSSGWSAVVSSNPDYPALFSRPTVYLVVDPSGNPQIPKEIDLYEAARQGNNYGQISHLLTVGVKALTDVQAQLLVQTMEALPPSELGPVETPDPGQAPPPASPAMPPGTSVEEGDTMTDASRFDSPMDRKETAPNRPVKVQNTPVKAQHTPVKAQHTPVQPQQNTPPKHRSFGGTPSGFARKPARKPKQEPIDPRILQATPGALIATPEVSPWDVASSGALPRVGSNTTRVDPSAFKAKPKSKPVEAVEPATPKPSPPKPSPPKRDVERSGRDKFSYSQSGQADNAPVPAVRLPRRPLPEESDD